MPKTKDPEHVMTIKLDAETGKLLGVWDNEEKVKGIPLSRYGRRIQLKKVPLSLTNVSTIIFSHGSPGCFSYTMGGVAYCVPRGC